MPRASWRRFLRPSLVSCPIYLSPATNEESDKVAQMIASFFVNMSVLHHL